MREVDATWVGRHVVTGAEMAARQWRYSQLHRPVDDDAVLPIGTHGNAVQFVIEVDVKHLSSAVAPHWLIAARDHDAVRNACQVSYVHLGSTGLV
jgi:hypothetical protein